MTFYESPILVTGASGGIGSAIVRLLSSRGETVIPIVRHTNRVSNLPPEPASMSVDLADKESIRQLSVAIRGHCDSVKWFIHCAGYIDTDGTHESVEKNFAINTFAPISLTESLIDKIQPGGGVVFITSTAGIWGSPAWPIYSASKSALHGYAFALQKRIGDNRRCVVIAPGPTNTPMRERVAHDAAAHQSPETVAAHVIEILDAPYDASIQQLFVLRDDLIEYARIETL